uniref:Uncharacterized protein n=1 Tax=Siphoviridae sp. ctBLh2 TaxID=2827803 RepID=A0A8S5S368_9CAUD|nr:MAG TPA: hypothetical protein [Siphoviridae sp. ctBLh2]
MNGMPAPSWNWMNKDTKSLIIIQIFNKLFNEKIRIFDTPR